MSREFKAPLRNTVNSTFTIDLDKTVKENCINHIEDDFVQKRLQELIDKKNREERKANGRLVAIILASLVIFLAIYHAWIRKSSALAGILVPIIIMVSFGAWVVILTRRDRARRAVFEKYLEEVALKKRQELEAKIKLKGKNLESNDLSPSLNQMKFFYKNELIKNDSLINRDNNDSSINVRKPKVISNGTNRETYEHRKHRKRRSIKILSGNRPMYNYATSTITRPNVQCRRSSVRQKLFGQNGRYELIAVKRNNKMALSQLKRMSQEKDLQLNESISLHSKRNRLQRQKTVNLSMMVRTSSIP